MTRTEVIRPILDHWSGRTWLRTAHVVTAVPIALAGAVVIAGLGVVSVLLAWTVVVPVIALLVLFLSVRGLTHLHRARFAAFLDVEIPITLRIGPDGNPLRRLTREIRRGGNWLQLAYHLLALPVGAIGCLLVVGAWSGSVIGVIVAGRGIVLGYPPMVLAGVGIAALLFVVAPWLARGVTALDLVAAEFLLGPSLSDQLVQRVEELGESRAELVDAADAERRRIERDLHDGAQQRLISLAMGLGVARATLTDLPESGRRVIERAHEEAKQALTELRDLVRGLHPAVLNDQGLDAALSGLVARAPLSVRLEVDVARRASPRIESVAFFVVSEALANVAKHARASTAEVRVHRRHELLHLMVYDDGRGGADAGRGSGLRGLAQRVGSVDGNLRVHSPAGGPTTITVELPCE